MTGAGPPCPGHLLRLVDRVVAGSPPDVAAAVRLQAGRARVVSEVEGRRLDLEVPPDAPPVPASDGPLSSVVPVVGPTGEVTGELLVWVRQGRLTGLERPWWSDDPPTTWPGLEDLRAPLTRPGAAVRQPAVAVGSGRPVPVVRLEDVARSAPGKQVEPPRDWFDGMALLQETQVLSVLHDAVRGTATVLLECRQALQLRADVAVLVLDGTTSLTWEESGRRAPAMAWSVVGGERRRDDGRLVLRLDAYPTGSLQVAASRAVLHVLDVPGLGDAPVDYTDDDDTVRAGTPHWGTEGTPIVSYRL